MWHGPKPLEVARYPYEWWKNSEEFFTAGEVLYNTQISSNKEMHTKYANKKFTPESIEAMRRSCMSTPIIFNLAFSCELLVKAILIKQDPKKWVPDQGSVKFGHDVYHLIIDELGIELNELETKIAKRLSDYISYGKYPERTRPGNIQETLNDLFDYHPYVSWSMREYYEIISSLRKKLRDRFMALLEKENS